MNHNTIKPPNRVPEKYLYNNGDYFFVTVIKDGKQTTRALGRMSRSEAEIQAKVIVDRFMETGELPEPRKRGRKNSIPEPHIYVSYTVRVGNKYVGTRNNLDAARKLRDDFLA